MKTTEEIFEDTRTNEDIPNYSNILEINCFMCLRILLKQYYNKHITQEQATKQKQQIFKTYEQNKKQYEADKSMHEEYIENIIKTEDLRTMLRLQLKEQSKYSLDTALKLIELYSNERWNV